MKINLKKEEAATLVKNALKDKLPGFTITNVAFDYHGEAEIEAELISETPRPLSENLDV
jgi:hypothetical protein